ncbi:MAG TPA: hypothetical protein ENN96_02480, partial [Candidatus Acetothermia bacterium]|nr:hypothetical protein [Candidatus Acetothermia bacterium]
TTAYAFVSYWTAYLKANYPTHFMASLLTSVQGDLDKVSEYVDECRGMGIRILPPDINASEHGFVPADASSIRFGLDAVKHVGHAAVEAVLGARSTPFDSLFELCRRVRTEGLDREALEALIKVGAFDRTGATRRGLLLHLPDALEMLHGTRREVLTGQTSLFQSAEAALPDPAVTQQEFSTQDLLFFEHEMLGMYLTGHPLDGHREELELYCASLQELSTLRAGEQVMVGGRVKSCRRVETKRKQAMAFVLLEDGRGEAEVTVFPRVLEGPGAGRIEEDALLGFWVTAGKRNGDVNLVAEDVFPLDEISQRARLALDVTLDGKGVSERSLEALVRVLGEHRGEAPVMIRVRDPLGCIQIRPSKRFFVHPSETLRRTLGCIEGVIDVAMRNGGST